MSQRSRWEHFRGPLGALPASGASIEAGALDSMARPGLFDKLGQILCPVLLTHAARIDHVGQIVFRVGENKISVSNSIVSGTAPCFSSRRYPRSLLGCLDGGLASCKADKALIKMIQPRADYFGGVSCRISGDEYQLDLIPEIRGHFLKGPTDIGHVERTLIGATGIAEKEERDVSLGLWPEVKRSAGGIRQSKSGFRQGRCHQAASVRCFTAIGVGRVRFPFLPQHNRRVVTQ